MKCHPGPSTGKPSTTIQVPISPPTKEDTQQIEAKKLLPANSNNGKVELIRMFSFKILSNFAFSVSRCYAIVKTHFLTFSNEKRCFKTTSELDCKLYEGYIGRIGPDESRWRTHCLITGNGNNTFSLDELASLLKEDVAFKFTEAKEVRLG